jgi:hypothetical protein
MIIRRRSPFTGDILEWDLPVTQEQLDRWRAGELIQRAMPGLTAPQREFIISGATPDDWEVMKDDLKGLHRNPDDWGFVHPGCAPEPGSFRHLPVGAFINKYVQLMFPTGLEEPHPKIERMWVFVTGLAETPGQELHGYLDNDPIFCNLNAGDEFEFNRDEIVKVNDPLG